MELAIPLVALGSLYIVSNQSKKNEGFASKLPNVDTPDKNYPPPADQYNGETEITSQLAKTHAYNGPSAYTDKYFPSRTDSTLSVGIQNATSAQSQNQMYSSLDGREVDSSYFNHNNMTPFFGSKLRGAVNPTSNESMLDTYLGAGSLHREKQEQAPLFSPNEKVQHTYGAPNMNDFYQSRVVPSMSMNGVKPFQEERDTPGLRGGGDFVGYNSGMGGREAWMPKGVDELRSLNRQKATDTMLLGHEGPAVSQIKNVGLIGTVQKNRPDTAFEWGPERYFTTTGAVKGQTAQAIPIDRYVSRPETTVEYEGIRGVAQGIAQPMDPGTILTSHRTANGPTQLGVANAVGKAFATEGDFGAKSTQVYMNNRTYNYQENDSYFGSMKSGIGAVIAPIVELLRPSRKENVVGNMRVYGDAKSTVGQGYLYNPNDVPSATMRDTTQHDPMHWNVNRGQTNNGYLSTPYQVVEQNRDTTTQSYVGGAGSAHQALRPYDAELSYVPNDMKNITAKGRMGNGNIALFNGNVNYQGKPKDLDLINNRASIPKMPAQNRSLETFGSLQTKSVTDIRENTRNDPNLYDVLKQNPYALRRNYQ